MNVKYLTKEDLLCVLNAMRYVHEYLADLITFGDGKIKKKSIDVQILILYFLNSKSSLLWI